MDDQIPDQSEPNLKNTNNASPFDGEWNKITEPIRTFMWVITKVRKTRGGYVWKEIASEKGDFEDLAYVLWIDYKQFYDLVPPNSPRDKRDTELEKVAIKLKTAGIPYTFYLPDHTDDFYLATVITHSTRVLPDGTTV
jgi:hypothetical protein